MHEKKFYLVIAVLVVTNLMSQRVFSQTVIDKAVYRCQYKNTTLKDTLDAELFHYRLHEFGYR